jgi:hypothetical protein
MRAKLAAGAAALLVAGLVVASGPARKAHAAGGPNLAVGRVASASSSHDVYGAANVNDGNEATYWESTNNAFPQWVQIDLGAITSPRSWVRPGTRSRAGQTS